MNESTHDHKSGAPLLSWREPWALHRRAIWREFMYLFFRSRLARFFVKATALGLVGCWCVLHLLEPDARFPYREALLGVVLLPCAFFSLIVTVLFPSRISVYEKIFVTQGSSHVTPLQLLAWRVQQRGRYRRIVLRYVGPQGTTRRRRVWLGEAVDRAALERRMRDFMARGEHERAKAGRP